MNLRPAVHTDIESMIELGRRMHAESPRFSQLRYDADKVFVLLSNAIRDDRYFIYVAEHDGVLLGGLAAIMAPHWFSPDQIAQDIAVFVDPDKRGTIALARLIKEYRGWAKGRGAVQTCLGISTGVMVERTADLYRALGFKQYGLLFEV